MNVIRETVRMAKTILEKELENEKSPFWKFKMVKSEKPRTDPKWQGHISVADIQWLEASRMSLERVKSVSGAT